MQDVLRGAFPGSCKVFILQLQRVNDEDQWKHSALDVWNSKLYPLESKTIFALTFEQNFFSTHTISSALLCNLKKKKKTLNVGKTLSKWALHNMNHYYLGSTEYLNQSHHFHSLLVSCVALRLSYQAEKCRNNWESALEWGSETVIGMFGGYSFLNIRANIQTRLNILPCGNKIIYLKKYISGYTSTASNSVRLVLTRLCTNRVCIPQCFVNYKVFPAQKKCSAN